MGRTEFGNSTGPGPSGWRRIILPFRWIAYRLVRPLLSEQMDISQGLEQCLAGLQQHQSGFEQELTRLRKELSLCKRALADARSEMAAIDKRVRQGLALGWDHVALVRRLASIEDRLTKLDASKSIGEAA